jgi:glycosyltransferase involved in cell wall biosynthesis
LFEALARVHDSSWELTVVGDGPLHDALVAQVARLGLSDRIRFVAATRDIVHVLRLHDVVIVPSLWEGYGIVAMEAMAAGRLVVVSDVGGLKDLVRDQETGLFAQPTVVDLTRVLEVVLQQQIPLRRLAERAQDYAYTYFDIRNEVVAYESLYRTVMARVLG